MPMTEREFYDKCAEIDDKDAGMYLIGHLICAISGSIVGFLIGYNLDQFLGWL